MKVSNPLRPGDSRQHEAAWSNDFSHTNLLLQFVVDRLRAVLNTRENPRLCTTMVSLRDGKSYDANAVTPIRHRTTRRSMRRDRTLDSTASLESQPDFNQLDSDELPPPDEQNRGCKRGRAAEKQKLESIDQSPHTPAKADAGQEALQSTTERTQLPCPESCSPSAKKKPRTASQPVATSKLTTSLAALSMAAAAIAILAVALWPYYGVTVTESVRGAVQVTGSCASGLLDKLSGAGESAAALAGSTSKLVQAHTSDIQRQVYMVLQQLHVKYPSVVPDGWRAPVGTADPNAWPSEALYGILPTGLIWQELSIDITDKLRTPAAQRSYKATAVILACATAEDCSHAATVLSAMPPRGTACSLLLNATSIAQDTEQPAAALQATLAPFLRRCPTGLVILQQVEQLPIAALPALHNALSELGGYQYGGTVDSSRAAYVFLMEMPVQYVFTVSASPDTSAVADAIKDAFFSAQRTRLQQQQHQKQDSPASEALATADRVLRTLHRRIDFAAPVRMGPAAEAKFRDTMKAQGSKSSDETVTLTSGLSIQAGGALSVEA